MKHNRYQLWLESDGGKIKVQLPVNPEKFTVKRSADNSRITVEGLGEVAVMNECSAVEISFSSIFPSHYFPGCSVKKLMAAYFYATYFQNWMTNKKPVRFTATGCGVVMYMTVENFQYTESGGDVGTYEYSVTLKEYRSAKVRQITIDKTTQKASVSKQKSSRVNNKTTPKTHTVVSGDNLWNIAKKYYGKGSEYMKIYEANKKIIGSNPNLIKPPQVLTIP